MTSAWPDDRPEWVRERIAATAHLPGRCRWCGWHEPTQGHDPTCATLSEAPMVAEPVSADTLLGVIAPPETASPPPAVDLPERPW